MCSNIFFHSGNKVFAIQKSNTTRRSSSQKVTLIKLIKKQKWDDIAIPLWRKHRRFPRLFINCPGAVQWRVSEWRENIREWKGPEAEQIIVKLSFSTFHRRLSKTDNLLTWKTY